MKVDKQKMLEEMNEKKYGDDVYATDEQIKRHEKFMSIANKLIKLASNTKKHVSI